MNVHANPETATSLLREDREGIAVLTLNRPSARNSLSEELIKSLSAAWDAIAADLLACSFSGTRPWAFWRYEAGDPDLGGQEYPREGIEDAAEVFAVEDEQRRRQVAWLAAEGLLTHEERAQISASTSTSLDRELSTIVERAPVTSQQRDAAMRPVHHLT